MTRREIANMYNLPLNSVAYYTSRYDLSDIKCLDDFISRKKERRPRGKNQWPQVFKKYEVQPEKIERITQEYGKDNHKRYWAVKGFKRVGYMNYSTE